MSGAEDPLRSRPPEQKVLLTTRVAGLTGGSDKSNYSLTCCFTFIWPRFSFARSSTGGFGRWAVPLAVITVRRQFAVYVEAMRNGIAELAIVLGVAVILGYEEKRSMRRLIAVDITLALALSLHWFSVISLCVRTSAGRRSSKPCR